jgi:hypothetical protein
MSRSSSFAAIATLGIDLGKTTFHLVGQDERGAIVLRIKLSRTQLTQRLAGVVMSGWRPFGNVIVDDVWA